MRKSLIIFAMALFAMPLFAQTIETVDVKQAPNGPFTTTTNECTINGNVENGQKVANVDTLWRVAEALGIRLSELIRQVEDQSHSCPTV